MHIRKRDEAQDNRQEEMRQKRSLGSSIRKFANANFFRKSGGNMVEVPRSRMRSRGFEDKIANNGDRGE